MKRLSVLSVLLAPLVSVPVVVALVGVYPVAH